MGKTGMMEIAFTNGIVMADAKTGMIDLTSIEKVGNMFNGLTYKDEGYKRFADWNRKEDTKEFVKVCEKKSVETVGIIDAETVGYHTIPSPVLSIGRGRSKTTGTIHIALKFAMWISKEFEYEVIDTFVKGKILDFRMLGIDHFKALNNLIDTLEDRVGKESNKGCYIQISKAVNTRINGEFIKGWDYKNADKDKQALRTRILDMSEQVMKMGMIKTYVGLKEFIVNFK